MFNKRARQALAISGGALLSTGVAAVFISTNATGTAALIAAGVAVVVLASYGDRIASVEAGGMKFQFVEAAASQLVAADQAEAAGDLDAATRLRGEAAHLLEAAQSAATRYEDIRTTQGSGWERTAQLELLVRQQAQDLSSTFGTPEAVRELFETDREGNRILAIVMMHIQPQLAISDVVAQAIASPRTAFEQYHALKAAEALAGLPVRPDGMQEVRAAIEDLLASGRFDAHDSDRGHVARRVLRTLSGRAPTR